MTENPPMAPVDINGTIWTIIYYVHPHILLIEAVMHSVKSLTELGQAYFTNKPLIKVLKFLEYFVLASYNLTLYSRHLTLVLSAYLWPLMDYIFPFLEDTTL
ncbi:hypothetical protein K7432_003867 [Basidiobolus ranarum]|uniref:Uncharacterized protein n=1 Tax=Basidiobolus ranarum TaxID=34480 RepID=A0ABR2W5H9_9FUNG